MADAALPRCAGACRQGRERCDCRALKVEIGRSFTGVPELGADELVIQRALLAPAVPRRADGFLAVTVLGSIGSVVLIVAAAAGWLP